MGNVVERLIWGVVSGEVEILLSECGLGVIKKVSARSQIRWTEVLIKGYSSIIHFVLDSISLRNAPNILYYYICSLQPMEIYVDDEAKLTLHGLVQVCR